MITVENLTKDFGSKRAVDSLSFTLRPGAVTGFLGPNGSGKSTTLRCIVGLDRPTAGRATIGGTDYTKLDSPLTKVGALLDGKAFHPGRTARQHLLAVAATHNLPAQRVDEVLAFAGITEVANQKVKGFSLGMGQRLGIATAMLGDPEILILDEPVNGLDPDGVRWIRSMMRSLAAEGRTILVSSHLMSEMSQTADDLIIIGRGRLLDSGPIEKFTEGAEHSKVLVEGPDLEAIRGALAAANMSAEIFAPTQKRQRGWIEVTGQSRADVGRALYNAHVEIHELSELHTSLEDVFLGLTSDSIDYVGSSGGPAPSYNGPHGAPDGTPNSAPNSYPNPNSTSNDPRGGQNS